MALLNLILLPLLAFLSLLTPDGGGGDGGEGGAQSDPPPPEKGSDTDDEPLGEPGKKALAEERKRAREADRAAAAEKRRADAAEAELTKLREASQTESEKALTEARKEAAREERTKWESRTLRSEAKGALAAAGASDVSVAVAAFLDEHRELKVNDNGDVEELDATVQTFREAHPTLFTARVPGGSADQGARPPGDRPQTWEEAISASYDSTGRPITNRH